MHFITARKLPDIGTTVLKSFRIASEPMRALQLAAALGILPAQVTLVGCEPEDCEVRIGLTRAVDAAVDRAVETIRRLVRAERHGNDNTAPGCTVSNLDCRGQL